MTSTDQGLAERIEALQAEHEVPAVAAAVIADGKAVVSLASGSTRFDGGDVVTGNTLFRIGSTTKILTGLLVGQAVTEGVLDLDAPVVSLLPGFRLSDPEATRVCTMRHLMTHTSGLPSLDEHHGSRDDDGLRLWVEQALPNVPLGSRPGQAFRYSNIGISVAGRVLEVALGKSYADLVATRLFGPLGMARSTFDPLVAMTYDAAQSHLLRDGALQVQRPVAEHTGLRPSGFAFCSLNDLVLLAGAVMGDRPDVVSPEVLDLVTTSQVRAPVGPGVTYGLGMLLGSRDGHRYAGHGGEISSFSCRFETYPDAGVAIIVLTSRSDAAEEFVAAVEELVPALLGEAPESPQEPLDGPDEWSSYAGAYRSPELGALQVETSTDGLVMTFSGRTQTLQQLGAGFYLGEATTLAFPGADPDHCHIDGQPLQRSAGDEVIAEAPDPALLMGTYFSTEWDVTVRVHALPDGVAVEVDGDPGQHVLSHVDGPRFLSPTGPVAFRFAEDGAPADALVAAGGVVLERQLA